MGALCKLVEALLFVYFLFLSVVAPLFDAQVCLSPTLFPTAVVDLKNWYSAEYGDYLVSEKPGFFTGIVWLELVLLWPLSLVNLFGIVAGKAWLSTTCLIHGVTVFTSMVAILSELTGSGKAPEKLLMVYYPFVGAALLTILRGLVSSSGKTSSGASRRAPAPRKKRA